MNALSNLTNSWVQNWLKEASTASARMAEDESFRQEVASRATNWAKQTPSQMQAELNKKAEQRASFDRQHKEFIKSLEGF